MDERDTTQDTQPGGTTLQAVTVTITTTPSGTTVKATAKSWPGKGGRPVTCQRVTEYASGREARDDLGRVLVLLEARLSALILVAEGAL